MENAPPYQYFECQLRFLVDFGTPWAPKMGSKMDLGSENQDSIGLWGCPGSPKSQFQSIFGQFWSPFRSPDGHFGTPLGRFLEHTAANSSKSQLKLQFWDLTWPSFAANISKELQIAANNIKLQQKVANSSKYQQKAAYSSKQQQIAVSSIYPTLD